MQLSQHFTVADLSKSQTALRLGIPNEPDAIASDRLKTLCENVLEKVYAQYGTALYIDSGYRGYALNMRIGGSKHSQHLIGEAADIIVNGVPNRELFGWIAKNVEFDQLILEFDNPVKKSGWVHVSFSKVKNRKETLEAIKDQLGRTVYRPLVP